MTSITNNVMPTYAVPSIFYRFNIMFCIFFIITPTVSDIENEDHCFQPNVVNVWFTIIITK